ncbi:MAG: SMC family ATPase [Anaerolineales bacterium]|nr:SMC family ATPase [Anaerolineales bacterium]
MIPLQLRLSGFLSYRDPIEVNFTTFELACISGPNGAGKSSLLDAITWSLFGQARKRDDSVVNLQSDAAEVEFTFSYEENIYRVQRSLPRGKGTVLEFQVQDGDTWRPLTERTLRETQTRIEQVLRLDYDTFVNAAFFLQGKADQFTQQTASKRKEVLGSILGLEAWETYRVRTAERRRTVEDDVRNIDGRITEIDNELAEEDQRKAHLTNLERELKGLAKARKTQETALENMKKVQASLENQRKLVETLATALERSQAHLSGLQARLAGRETESATYADLLKRAADVESAYEKWKQTRAESERLDEVGAQFREHEKRRQPLLEEIAVEKAKLEQEQLALSSQQSAVSEQALVIETLRGQIETAKKTLAEVEIKLGEHEELEKQAGTAREKMAELRTENQTLKVQMDELKTRIDRLQATEGATCPLCGQDLSEEHRKSTLAGLEAVGKTQGDRYRANTAEIKALAEQITDYESRITNYASIEQDRRSASTMITQLTERLESLQKQDDEWKATGKKRLIEVSKSLEKESFAAEARKQLKEVDQELAALGYDAAAHDAVRKAESEQRVAEEEYQNLEKARAALKPIENEIDSLKSEIVNRKSEVEMQQKEHDEAVTTLAASEAQAPDVDTAMDELLRLQEQENRLTQEVGAARQKVSVLDDLRVRKTDYAAGREGLQRQIARHKTLERAFGKDGVPALLIEQALPQIETRANELLDRLSDGQMSVRFVTQAEYKDKKRDDLKETLDIQISDGAGVRDYEMYSGGETFRVNFAIRLALSEVLAQRKGARLQTLVIDEGFGSQDTQGRQRLIEAINLVKDDFAKILVITHLDELKDAFPTRIEVEKTVRGSTVQVI